MTLASLFFYPLTASLYDQPWYFQWKPINTIELAVAIALVATMFSVFFWGIRRCRQPWMRLALFLPMVAVPVAVFLTHFVRQLGLTALFVRMSAWMGAHSSLVIFGLAVVGCLALIAAFRWSRAAFHLLILVLLVLSPLTLFSLVSIAHSFSVDTRTSISSQIGGRRVTVSETAEAPSSIVVLLFDELSYRYVYDVSQKNVRPEFPRLAALSSVSTNYHLASSATQSTLTSVPSLFFNLNGGSVMLKNNRLTEFHNPDEEFRLRDNTDNVFFHARERGLSPMAFGPYFRYCILLKLSVDRCHSYSVYNVGSLHPDTFSLAHPFATNAVLWPHQRPFGWIKRLVYAQWQRDGIVHTYEWTIDALRSDKPVFLFSHFYVPHLPFVFSADGFNPVDDPFLQNEENYIRQLGYVDTLVGNIVDELKRQGKFDETTIVILSDHDYRAMTSSDEQTRVPLMVKRAGQRERLDIFESAMTTDVLWEIVMKLPLVGL